MVKPKRGRCVKNNINVHKEPEEVVQAPHSFVIHKGLSGGHTLELTKDFRKVMEPYTASSLKERKRNTIKDFVAVAGPLHVSHLSIFSRTELGMYLKICRLPRGPSMTFKIHNFSLARDVVSSLKKQNVVEQAFKHSPLIVLNSFSGEGLHMKLMASMFQNMFPTINLTNVDLNTVRRCVLLNYNPATKLIDFRHFTIKVIPVGISKGVKKVVHGKVPNLAHCNDISEFLTKAGLLSESEVEDDPSNQVTLSQKLIARGNVESGKSSIRLTELGPRLTLQLMKIEDGLLDGEVLYHDLIEKTEEEKLEIQKKRASKKNLKEKRKKIQDQNKIKKEQTKQDLKAKSLQGMHKTKADTDITLDEKTTEIKNDFDDDAEYYRQEVGEEPDKDLFTSSRGRDNFRPPHSFQNKRKFDSNGRNNEKDSHKNKRFKANNPRDNEKDSFKNNRFKKTDGRDNKKGLSKNKNFKKNENGSGKFKNKKDKTNSESRDHRPIGGSSKFGGKSRMGRKPFNKRH